MNEKLKFARNILCPIYTDDADMTKVNSSFSRVCDSDVS